MPTLAEYLENPPHLVGPDYTLYKYTDQIYKVIHFKQPRSLVPNPKRQKPKTQDENKKPDSSVSRARRNVLELALCNDWSYFCTFTLDKEKYDRFNLDAWKNDFTQWIRDLRKKYKKIGLDCDFKFLFVPERHDDGAWHMHGLFGDIRPLLIPFYFERQKGMKVPDKLVNGGYFDWPEYREKFGFCSFGIIKNKVATAFYVTKYISKNLQSTCEALGVHSYIPSRGLNRAQLHGSVYGDCWYLDSFLTNKYEFVETGMTCLADGADWDFAMEYMDKSDIKPLDLFSFDSLEESDIRYIENHFEGIQTVLEGFP